MILKYHYVYLITNLINNRKYIGKRSYKGNPEDDKYLGSGKYISRAVNKYGPENFSKEIIEFCETSDEAYEREAYWITHYNAVKNSDFYNLSEGGKGSRGFSFVMPEEAKQKIGISKRGERNHFYGKGYLLSGENNGMYGKKHTREAKEKMSKNNCMNQEYYRQNLSKIRKGSKLSEETKRKISESSKTLKLNKKTVKVVYLNGTIEYYNSFSDMLKKLKVASNTIRPLINTGKEFQPVYKKKRIKYKDIIGIKIYYVEEPINESFIQL